MNRLTMRLTWWAGILWVVLAVGAKADDQAQNERIAELERKVEALSREAERKQYGDIFIPVGDSKYGLGPAASKIYFKEDGLSLGGYGEALYQNRDDSADTFDFLRAVLYVGYKFNEKWVFNSELEWEHASTDKEGSTSVEFAYLDYLHHEALNVRAGLVLIPVGLVNELHEPTTFLSATRPFVENRIIPTTWRENGAGLFGDVGPMSYKTYVVNGLDGEDFSGKGLRSGRQKGSKAKAEDFAWVGRLDWNVMPGLLVGGSGYYGRSGQDLDIDLTTSLWEGHADWKWKGLSFRALGVVAEVDDAAALNAFKAQRDEVSLSEVDSVGEELWGWYVELGYDVLNMMDSGSNRLTPYVRWEQFDTQSELPAGASKSAANDIDSVTVGLNYKPIDQIVFKGEWQRAEDADSNETDLFNLAMGYVF